jgi:hypothetical protein
MVAYKAPNSTFKESTAASEQDPTQIALGATLCVVPQTGWTMCCSDGSGEVVGTAASRSSGSFANISASLARHANNCRSGACAYGHVPSVSFSRSVVLILTYRDGECIASTAQREEPPLDHNLLPLGFAGVGMPHERVCGPWAVPSDRWEVGVSHTK